MVSEPLGVIVMALLLLSVFFDQLEAGRNAAGGGKGESPAGRGCGAQEHPVCGRRRRGTGHLRDSPGLGATAHRRS